jgi:solute carrier family 26 (sodium-independent sulfate anion transporter), member 11
LDDRPTLKAVILDFSSVNNLDLTSVQSLIDVRNQLDRHAAPRSVQWHFACIQNRWAKRALAAAGFGYPSFETDNGTPQHFKAIYSLADMKDAEENIVADHISSSSKAKAPKIPGVIEDIEMGDFTSQQEKIVVEKMEGGNNGKMTKQQAARMTALHGINRPYFHPDIQSALTSAIATEELHAALGNESPGAQPITERLEVDEVKSREK